MGVKKRALDRWLPAALAGAAALALAFSAVPSRQDSPFAVDDFARLPVLSGGRLKPLDTVARTSLLLLSGKQTLKRRDGRREEARAWLLDVLFKAAAADEERVFEIDDPDVLGVLGLKQTRQRLFSFNELRLSLPEIERQASQANQIKPEARSRYQSAAVNLEGKVSLYEKLENTLQPADATSTFGMIQFIERQLARIPAHGKGGAADRGVMKDIASLREQFGALAQAAQFAPFAEEGGGGKETSRWFSEGEAVAGHLFGASLHPGVLPFAAMGDTYRMGDAASFNQALEFQRRWMATEAPAAVSWARYEFLFNAFDPFYKSLLVYLAAFLLVFVSWLAWPETLGRAALWLAVLAFAVHTAGLTARIAIQGRPPVTNLYSSAIFVGWVAVLLGLVLERLFKKRIGTMVAAAIGFLTLIIALHLDNQGDTMEMMRAVLDSNFWLATHVTSITVGYGSTFLSGFLGVFYILRGWFGGRRDEEQDRTLESMAYGVVCFSLFFSFLGTILGGIWADQSWGRFWGWDPKENGALMIVLWNATVLHARWGKVVDRRGFMAMTVFGNIVTGLSWFGVNMLGIGLHSYGFMDKAFMWLMVFIASQLAVMTLAFLPKNRPLE